MTDKTAESALAVGERIRLARLAAHQSQHQLGRALGYSASAISRIETGRRAISVGTLRAIGTALRIPPAQLGLMPAPAARAGTAPRADTPAVPALPRDQPVRVAATHREAGDEPVERRTFLAGVTGVAAVAALGPGTRSGTSAEAAVARLSQALFTRPLPPEPLGVDRVRAALAGARADFAATRYESVIRQLPDLIVHAESARAPVAGAAGTEAVWAAQAGVYVLASQWCVKQNEDQLGWVTADRALQAARKSGRPAAVGEAAKRVAVAMRRDGQYRGAADLLIASATDLDGSHAAAIYGSLLLTAAYAAAQGGDRSTAVALADEAAGRSSAGGGPGLDQVNLYRISILHAVGDDTGALACARHVDVRRLPTPERRARYCLDVARAHQTLGHTDRVYQALLAAERHAPEDVRRPSVRTLVGELLYAPGAMPGLRSFARRVGAA